MSSNWHYACAAGAFFVAQIVPGFADPLPDPTDPNAPAPRLRYHSVLSGYEYQPIPGKPGNWRELNDRMEQIGGPAGQLRDPSEPIRKKKKQQ